MNNDTFLKISEQIKKGAVGVLPSDTIYGLFASAEISEAVEKIYQLKKRDLNKPLIIHITSIDQIQDFAVSVDAKINEFLQKMWPGPVSVILPSNNEKLAYLNRNSGGISFRLITSEPLLSILKETGPLVGTSVNISGDIAAETIDDAKNYFGDTVDFYLDVGKLPNIPSTVIALNNDTITIIRQGAKIFQSLSVDKILSSDE